MSTPDGNRDELLAEVARSELGRRSSGTEGRVESPFAFAPDELLVIDLEGRIVEANPRACENLGYARDELVGRPVWELSTRQTEEGFRKLVEAIQIEGPQYLFGHNRRRDGTTYAIEARLWIAPRDGTPHVFGLLRDQRGTEGIIEERDQLISLIENSAETIAVATPDGVTSYMNPAGREMLGLSDPAEVVGRALVELHAETSREHFEQHVLPAMRRGRWRGELFYRNFGHDGATPCWVNAFAIRHSQTDEVIGLALIAHDITERKAAERQREKLLALNEVSRRVATSLLELDDLNRAIGIVLSGVGRILGVSRSYLCRYREDRQWVFRTHQWTAEEGDVHLIQPRPESSQVYAWATDMLVRGAPIRITDVKESGVVPREGEAVLRSDVRALLVLPVIIHGRLENFFGFVDTERPREWEDEELALLEIIVDSFARAIERRIAEREREEIARDLEKSVARERTANRYKSEFLAKMSHELRTPMNSIVGYAELLSRPNVDREKHETWIGHITRSTHYLLALINDVLDLSKIEAGEMTVATQPCSLPDTVANVVELLGGQAREKMLDFRAVYEGEVPEWIVTDRVRLEQILVNLVGNAIKFTPQGSVRIKLSTTAGEPPRLVVDVIDTGIGIPRDEIEKLFRPFSQVHGSSDARFRGSGLGLDISRHLARLLGGEITVESTVGLGSVFTLRLPLEVAEREADAEHEPVAAAPPDLTGRRVLIVDDCPENRDVLRFLLEESGCETGVAEDGARGVEEALAAQREGHGYDVVLMDMNMPVLDGLAATRRLLARGLEAPIVALTALALAGDEERCRAAGCVDYVAKPIVPSAFLETVGRHVARSGAGEREPPRAPAAEDRGDARREPASSQDSVLALVDNPRFRPLIDRYVASFDELLVELREQLEAGRLDTLRTRVHRVRGTAANYGFPAISEAAGRCEDAIRTRAETEEVDRLLAELEALLREARNAS